MKEFKFEVTEIFKSFQGEGLNAGKQVVFIRFHECNLKCSFCDEKEKTSFHNMSVNDIVIAYQNLSREANLPIVFTGGEPTLIKSEMLSLLLLQLKIINSDYDKSQVFLETNGTLPIKNFLLFDHISVSPKCPLTIIPHVLEYVNEFKYCVSSKIKNIVRENLIYQSKTWRKNIPTFVQPINNLPENIEICLKLIEEFPNVRLGYQLQKYWRIK